MTEENKTILETGGESKQPEEGGNSKEVGAEELKQQIENLKKENSGIYKKMSELEKLQKLELEEKEKIRVANLSNEDKLKELEKKNSMYEKKETWRNLCVSRGLDPDRYENSALKLDISDLETLADDLSRTAEAVKLDVTEKSKKEFQENISTNQPSNSEPKTQEQLTEEMLKSKGLL